MNLYENVSIDPVGNAGASDTVLNLIGIELSNLEEKTGSGEITVDLGGTGKIALTPLFHRDSDR